MKKRKKVITYQQFDNENKMMNKYFIIETYDVNPKYI
jgi:hypothetical protein